MKKQFSVKFMSVMLAVLLIMSSFSVCAFAAEDVCTEHNFDSGTVIKEATCTKAGSVVYTCTDCSYTKKEAVVPAGHFYSYDYLEETYVAPTCFSEGYEHYALTCPVCEEVILEIENTLSMRHKWVDVRVIEPESCVREGTMATACAYCGEESTRIIYPNSEKHSGKAGLPLKETCTENGYLSYGNCYECGRSAGGEVIPATGHSKDNYVLIKEATCTEAGLEYYDCTNINYDGPCGFVGEVVIPPLGHNYVPSTDYIAPDCGVQGVEPGLVCSVCGDVFMEETYYDYFEHDFRIDILAVADAENNGKTLYTCQNDTETSMFHVFEVEYSLSDVVPGAPDDGKFVVDADKSGVVGNIRELTGIYEENVSFTVVESDGITIDENGNVIADGSGEFTVLVETPSNAAKIEVEVRLFDSLEIVADDTLETGKVLDIEVLKQPFGVVADDVTWTSSDDSIVFVSDGKLIAVGAGTVTLTAVSGNLTVSKEFTLIGSGDTREIKFTAIDKMHYIVEDYFAIFNGETLYWSDLMSIRFKVREYGTFPFETYIVYINGKEAEADADGYFTVPADSGDVRVTITGAMFEGDEEGTGEKVSFWQAILNFFKKILAFFGIGK